MIRTVMTDKSNSAALWLDVVSPSPEELLSLVDKYQLHPATVKNCLDPLHLPKYEKLGDTAFIVLRAYDESASPRRDGIQSMTKKIAIFISDRFLITIHRREHDYLQTTIQKYEGIAETMQLPHILLEILTGAVETFYRPLTDTEHQLDIFERSLLRQHEPVDKWRGIFKTKNRLMVIKRMLWHAQSTVQKLVPSSEARRPLYQDLRERIENLYSFADELLDDMGNLLNIQISLASHRTNEVVRILTLFSVVFMPLTFIVGVYGMNFHFMPELSSPYGYAYVWGLMILTTLVLYLWFRNRGWLRN